MDSIIRFLYANGLFAMFVIILLEYACFPVSSEIVLPLSGALASLQGIPFLLLLLVSICAGLLGTGICYMIGRIGGKAIMQRITKRFPRTEKSLASSQEKMERLGPYAVCFGRMIPICRTYIAFVAGSVEQPAHIFFGFSALGIAAWNTLLIGLGYFLRENWTNTVTYYSKYKSILIPLLLIIILLFINKHKKSKNNIPKPPESLN